MTQKEKIFEIFKRSPNKWIPCYLLCNVALQYNARISDLRHDLLIINNRYEFVKKVKHSSFKWVSEPCLEDIDMAISKFPEIYGGKREEMIKKYLINNNQYSFI